MSNPPALSHETYYHIYNRGINRETIFPEPRNYSYFLMLYAKYVVPVADTYAYCLLGNHFHLLVKIKSQYEIETLASSHRIQISTPSMQFSRLFNAYAKAINKAYQRTGSLLQHPFGRNIVKSWRQFQQILLYIHLNPRKHNLVQDFRSWPYSSYPLLMSGEATFLPRNELLDHLGGRLAFEELHAEYERSARWLESDIEG